MASSGASRCSNTNSPRGEPRKNDSGWHDTTVHVATPDLVSTNPQRGTTAYDVVVVGVTHRDGFRGAARKSRWVETTPAGGKGPNATASNGQTRTPPRAVSFKEINTPKAVRTVTHGVDTDNSPSSVSEAMAKDQQVVEAVLRDKDPERSQAQGTGKHSNRKRTTQRAKQGSGDEASRAHKVSQAETRHARHRQRQQTSRAKSRAVHGTTAKENGKGQHRAQTVFRQRSGPRAPPTREARIAAG
jgi:hypothetical protein